MRIDVRLDIVQPKQYIIAKTKELIKIDGLATESAWQHAPFSDKFIDIEGVKKPKFETRFKMLWDDQFLYVFAQMEEPHIWGDIIKRDAVIFYNNDFEIFISPSGTTRNYGEIEINSLGTVWDLLLNKPYRDRGKANTFWNLDLLKSEVHHRGTVNNPSDTDSLWTVEMAIPMKALLVLKNSESFLPREGEQWRMNFSRVEWDFDLVNNNYQRKRGKNGKALPEYNWVWSNQNVINMHEPEKWGYVQFTDSSRAEGTSFIEDKNEKLKQVAYALYRRTKRGNLKKLVRHKTGFVQQVDVQYGADASLSATYYKTNGGFEYKIVNPQTTQTFIINETGALKEIK
jgi:hypothetical protein